MKKVIAALAISMLVAFPSIAMKEEAKKQKGRIKKVIETEYVIEVEQPTPEEKQEINFTEKPSNVQGPTPPKNIKIEDLFKKQKKEED